MFYRITFSPPFAHVYHASKLHIICPKVLYFVLSIPTEQLLGIMGIFLQNCTDSCNTEVLTPQTTSRNAIQLKHLWSKG